MRLAKRCGLGILALATAASSHLQGCNAPESPPPIALGTDAFYVWQRNWTPQVFAGLDRAAPDASMWMVLCGEFAVEEDTVAFTSVAVDWQHLAALGVPVTAVFRANVTVLPELSGWTDGLARMMHEMDTVLDQAAQAGSGVAGIQLDFDCPTRALADFAGGLATLRRQFPDPTWSITALPTWLGEPAFEHVLAQVDYYVLQPHSFIRPKDHDQKASIFAKENFPTYLKQAAALGTPFVVSLPTYGYEMAFDTAGEFAGLRAETGGAPWPPGYSVARVMANPDDIAAAIADLKQNPPPAFCGVVWFRLPIAGESYNWPWETLAAVRTGEAPEDRLAVSMQRRDAHLAEIFVENAGTAEAGRNVSVVVSGQLSGLVAYDTANGFRVTGVAGERMAFAGETPAPGQSVQVGWLRFAEAFPEKFTATTAERLGL